MTLTKTSKNQTIIFFLLVACLMLVNTAQAQYQITWFTIDGGGGRSSSAGDTYTLEGTIGQPDAGLMSGGDYVLAGGFWPATSYCIVDLPDLAQFTAQWLISTGSPQADFNNSGKVDLFDYHHLATYWLRLCPDNWPWW